MFRSATITAVTLTVLLGSCAVPRGTGPFGVVSGSARYDEQMALPADANLEVRIYDVSQGGGDGRIIAQQVIKSPPQGPVPFQMRYDPRAIDPEHSYVVRARFTHGETPLLETPEPSPVLTHGHPRRAELVLERPKRTVARPAVPPVAQPTALAAPPAPKPEARPMANLDARPMPELKARSMTEKARPMPEPMADLEAPPAAELEARPTTSARPAAAQPGAPIELIPGLEEEAAD